MAGVDGAAPSVEGRTLRALGTEIALRGRDVDGAEAEIHRLEAILTRFRPSPLTRLNGLGRLDDPPPELVAALRHALDAAEASGGLVTPMVEPALVAAGYCASWPEVCPPLPGDPAPVADWRAVRVAPERIELPEGAGLDLGGTAKSWIAERALDRLAAGAGARPDALVDAGGDVISRCPEPCAVDLAEPFGDGALQLLLPAGRWGVATSSVLRRAWAGGHHLIDPRSARPARTAFVQVSVAGPSLCRAEVVAKAILLGAFGAPDGAPGAPGAGPAATGSAPEGGPAAPGVRAWLDECAMVVAFDREGRPWRWADPDWSKA